MIGITLKDFLPAINLFGEFKTSVSKRFLLGLLLVAAIPRFWIAWQPIEVLVTKNLPDDAFFYFVLARNVVSLGSASLDGINATNGFHPLWLIALLPIFGTGSIQGELPIHLALSLASLFDLLSIFLLGRLGASLLRDWRLGLAAGAVYAFNPVVVLQVTNGLETSLGILTLMVFLVVYRDWLRSITHLGKSVSTGILGGLMFLARTDSIFLFGLSMLAALWLWKKRQALLSVTIVLLTSLLTVSPWLIWSQLNVGSIFQDSGYAIPLVLQGQVNAQHGNGVLPLIVESLRQLGSPASWLRGDFTGLPLLVGAIAWLAILIPLIRRWNTNPDRLERALFFPSFLACALLIIVHAGLRWYARAWYFIPCSAVFALAYALALQSGIAKWGHRLFASSLLIIYFWLTGILFWNAGYYPWQTVMWRAGQWVTENLNTNERVASFINSGMLAYTNSPQVTNADGLINHHALEAIKRHSLLAYLKEQGVTYLIDADGPIWGLYAPFMGEGFPESLHEVHTLGFLNEGLGFLRVYRIEK